MANIYGEKALKWCKDNAPKSYLNCSDVEILTEFIIFYVNINKLNTKLITIFEVGLNIEPVPVEVVMLPGYYAEFEPGVWRLLCSDIDTYNKYVDFLNK